MRKIETQMSTGRWSIVCTEEYLETAARWRDQGAATVHADLDAGREVKYGSEWYEVIRDADIHRSRVETHRAASTTIEMVRCSCGHTIPRPSVMRASLGTSCPDCYDRMSG